MMFTPVKSVLSFAAVVAAFFALTAPAFAAGKDEIYTGRFNNLAAGGYDVVAYFTAGAPAKGSKEFATEYKRATWRFASQENLDLFTANPGQYAPQYGGYCAWALAQNKLAPGKPDHWKIVDGKLYLNFSAKVQRDWLEDVPGFISKANSYWPAILDN